MERHATRARASFNARIIYCFYRRTFASSKHGGTRFIRGEDRRELNPIRLIEIDNARHNMTPRMLIIAFAPFITGGDVQFVARVIILGGFRGGVTTGGGGCRRRSIGNAGRFCLNFLLDGIRIVTPKTSAVASLVQPLLLARLRPRVNSPRRNPFSSFFRIGAKQQGAIRSRLFLHAPGDSDISMCARDDG